MMALKLACFLDQVKCRMLLQGTCFPDHVFFWPWARSGLRGSLFPALMKKNVLMKDSNTGLSKGVNVLTEWSSVILHSLSCHSALITQKEVHILVFVWFCSCLCVTSDNIISNKIYWWQNFVHSLVVLKKVLHFVVIFGSTFCGVPYKRKFFSCCAVCGNDKLNLNIAANITLETSMGK